MKHQYTCPCCGFGELEKKPFENMPEISETKNRPAPYEQIWGEPSYEVCPCCGFEFGNDDNPGMDLAGETFESYRAEWIKDGCPWLMPNAKPANWRVEDQLRANGLDI